MKELREVEDFGVTSHAFKYGDLKMVKVRRGKRGHRQSRSLVFRISRSSKPISDDSGIKCDSSDEETSNICEQSQAPLHELKISIPKCVLQNTTTRKETDTIEYFSPEHQVLRNSLKVTTHEDVLDSKMDTLIDGVDDLNLNEVDLRSNRSILCTNSGILNDGSKEITTRTDETKLSELRRRSRRIVLRVQKECQPNYSVKESSNGSHKFSFGSSNSSELKVSLGEKRKRGRKPGFQTSECKKRKYCRRGRPPKSSFPKQLSLGKPIPSEGGHNEKLVIVAPPKNSVWTLVPKELFESEYFKSQLLQVRLPNSSEEGIKRNFIPVSFSSPSQSVQASGSKQAKTPVVNVNNAPVLREKTAEEKDSKRPTVIYFKTEKKKFDSSHDQRRELRNPQLLLPSQVSKIENDMLYLFNKYRMLKDIILKNYYELAGGNLNEAENMLSNFLSKSSDISQVYDLSSAGQASRLVVNSLLPSSDISLDDSYHSTIIETAFKDSLSREIIFQSLQILYSEEAVLG